MWLAAAFAASLLAPGCRRAADAGAGEAGTAEVPRAPAWDTLSAGQRVAMLMGPYRPSRTVAAWGPVFTQYESDFVRHDEAHWRQHGPNWEEMNYYDRAMIYYVWWQRTGDRRYLDRANALVLAFRRYLENADYKPAHHWAMMDGMALHFLVTGDTASLKAVGKVADFFAWTAIGDAGGYVDRTDRMDNRIQAYAIKSLLLAYRLHAPSAGIPESGIPGRNDWGGVLRETLSRILATRDPDGQWRGAHCGAAGRATHPFAIGLLHDALIRYHELFEPDPRILPAIRSSVEALWRYEWLPRERAFKYIGIGCPGEGGPTPAADLNNLIVNGFAWLYKTTGEATFRSRADEVFAGAVRSGASYLPKQFNQSYTSSYRYLGWR